MSSVALVLNTLGLVVCLGGLGLLVFRNRLVTRETDLGKREACLEQYFMGPYWLDLGVGALVVGFLFQILAAIL